MSRENCGEKGERINDVKSLPWGRVVPIGLLAAVVVMFSTVTFEGPAAPSSGEVKQVIVQAGSLTRAAAVVREAGGVLTRELGVIEAVAATVTAEQAGRVSTLCPECRIYPDRETRVMVSNGGGNGNGSTSASLPDSDYPTLIGATSLQSNEALTGAGVTVAVIDSGFLNANSYAKDTHGNSRIKAQYDAFTGAERTYNFVSDDAYGHGSHVVGIIGSSMRSSSGLYQGVAPDVGIVSVKAFDANGGSSYAAVIDAVGWVIAHKDTYNIRVMNGSFGASVGSWYWDDPMNQAIMKAWQAGIAVVVSAGNSGPDPMSILAPGNVPYVITVGAMTDNYTPSNGSDDYLATFSATGPTYEAHAKPDVVAPGGHDLSAIQRTSTLGTQFPQFFVDSTSDYYRLSGTSQAAAVVSGAVALMLQANPTLSPDDVKCGLMASAVAATKADGTPAYSVFQQGAGLVRVDRAVFEGHTGCANIGLDINADLAGTQHFAGRAAQAEDGTYYLADTWGDGTVWSGAEAGTNGYPWANGFPWSNGYPWANGFPWSNGYPWANGYPWSDLASESDSMETASFLGAQPLPDPDSSVGTPEPSKGQAGKSKKSKKSGKAKKRRRYGRVPGKVIPPFGSGIEVVKPVDQQ